MTLTNRQKLEIIKEAACRNARNDFLAFRKLLNQKSQWGWWQEEVAHELQQFERDFIAGKRPKLIIQAPPQHGKSVQGIDFIAYLSGKYPDKRTIYTSFSDRLGTRANLRLQRIFRSEMFQLIFPDFRIDWGPKSGYSANQELIEYIERDGYFRNTTVGGAITGESLDCLVAGTMINTDRGIFAIEELEVMPLPCKILSYNQITKALTYEELQGFKTSNSTDGIYRVTDCDGCFFECTGDHLVYTENRGYIKARELSESDYVLSLLPGGVYAPSLRHNKVHKKWGSKAQLLLKGVQKQARKHSENCKKVLPRLQRRVAETNRRALLKLLGNKKINSKCYSKIQENHKKYMPNVHESIRCGSQGARKLCCLLFKKMLRSRSLKKNVGEWQSNVESRHDSSKRAAALRKSVPPCKKRGFNKRRELLCNMQEERCAARGSSYRCKPNEQCLIEPNNSLFKASYRDAQNDDHELRTASRKIRSVIRVGEEAVTYDITVAKNHNFFANGILVHNCGVIDDPIKGRKDASSELVRDNAWQWFTDDFFSRFSDDAGLLIILTRWHVDDPVGRLIERDAAGRIKVLRYPAIAEHDEPHRKAGDPLFPEHKPLDFLLERKELMSAGNWEALYQQNPTVADGELFKPDRLRVVDAIPHGVTKWCRGWDLAASGNGDYTAGVKIGRYPDGQFIVVDVVAAQAETSDRDALLVNTTTADGYYVTQSVPQDPGQAGKSLAAYIVRALSGYVVHTSTESGDKISRADPVASQINVGNVMMLRGAWNSAFVDELRGFPFAKHDDRVDALSRAFNYLCDNRIINYGDLL
jgi:predicted phage terminase large subunit-like protein